MTYSESDVRHAVRFTLRSTRGLNLIEELLTALDDAADEVWVEDAFAEVVIDKLRAKGQA